VFNLDWQKGYEKGLKVGIANERNRIVALVEAWLDDDQGDLRNVLNLIKTDNKNTEKGQK
jgi:hypothetical protein